MARFIKEEDLAGVVLTEVDGQEGTVHIESLSDPAAIVMGSMGGYFLPTSSP